MPDNKQVLDPGWRALDANGDPYSGAKLKVFQAGTTTPRTVYSDDDLSSSLGSVITCDSGGYPTSDGNAKTLVYTGVNAFKLQLYTSADVLVWTHDDIPGALDTSGFGGDTRITSPISTVSNDQVLAQSDSGKLYHANCSGNSVLFTLGQASTLGDGWRVGIKHYGAIPSLQDQTFAPKVTTTGGELVALPGLVSATAFSLTERGQEIWIRCDGAGFSIGEDTPQLLGTTGVIKIADRVSSPPGSPKPGARYILLTTPTGDFSTFSQHDIVEANGQGGWIRYTPATDCGWLAYVKSERAIYEFNNTGWAQNTASDTVAGRIEIATSAEMETATDVVRAVVPGRQHAHPLHPKVRARFGVSGNILEAVNVTSITDSGTGQAIVNFTTAFSNVNYAASINAVTAAGQGCAIVAQAVGSMTVIHFNTNNATQTDPTGYHFMASGDQ